MRLLAPFTLAWTGRRLTFQRRLLTLWAWLMVFPNCGPLPQISQTRAITLKSFQACCRNLNFTGIRRISPKEQPRGSDSATRGCEQALPECSVGFGYG